MITFFCFAFLWVAVSGQDKNTNPEAVKDSSRQDLANKLQNPVANLISLPFQNNFEFEAGISNGYKYTLILQPVIPFLVGEKLNHIKHTIVPIVARMQVVPSSEITSTQTGLNDILFSAFLSPEKSGVTWDVGPALLFPTATNSFPGGKKWAAGSTAIVLKQFGARTVGLLTNPVWSYAGDDLWTDISSTFIQPLLSYVNKPHTTFSLSSESIYVLRFYLL